MKGLSIEEKAKRYDEVLAMAKSTYNGSYKPEIAAFVKVHFEEIFPELKESEDEKIRKEIISFLELPHPQFVGKRDHEKWIAWLEKQSESYTKRDVADLNEFVKEYSFNIPSDIYNLLPKEKQSTWINEIENAIKAGAQWLEKQGEQKVADIVEPKFKVGDWLVNNISKDVFLIKSINNGYYTLEDTKGNIISPCLPPCESESHLWTIQDAKDGDVLATDDRPFIYNGNINPLSVGGYCGITYDGHFKNYEKPIGYSTDGWTMYDNDIHPATKEQSDLLFSKMKDAGYEWDAEKRELKKISQRMISAEAKEAMYAKTAWSEDDEKMLVDAYVMLDWYKGNNWWTARRIKDWLNSLKERIGG